MKKSVYIVLILSLILSLGACGKKAEDTGKPAEYQPDEGYAYAVGYLWKSYDELKDLIGEPEVENDWGDVIQMGYSKFFIYVHKDLGAIEIDTLNGINPLEGFYTEMTYDEIRDTCKSAGIDEPAMIDVSNTQDDFKLCYRMKVEYHGYVLSYTWESDEDKIDFNTERNTRLTIYDAENYLWE